MSRADRIVVPLTAALACVVRAGPAVRSRLARDALGEMGRRPSTVIELSLVDADGDGVDDSVSGRAEAVPPRFVPTSLGGMLGFDRITASARVRVERQQ
jgi:hypothetical protein